LLIRQGHGEERSQARHAGPAYRRGRRYSGLVSTAFAYEVVAAEDDKQTKVPLFCLEVEGVRRYFNNDSKCRYAGALVGIAGALVAEAGIGAGVGFRSGVGVCPGK